MAKTADTILWVDLSFFKQVYVTCSCMRGERVQISVETRIVTVSKFLKT